MNLNEIGGVICTRSELLNALLPRAKCGDLEAVAECRRLLRDQARDVLDRDRRQRGRELLGTMNGSRPQGE